ncbi:MAG: hypothetical protein K6G45_13075 [Lachnospiraceae bacterium]|nr:hypothetical protein [Lachnospiraceae bacterium]
MKKFSKIAAKVLTVFTAAAIAFGGNGIKALAADTTIRFYVVKKGETVVDNTTATQTVGVDTKKFEERTGLRTTTDYTGSFVNERSGEEFKEAETAEKTEAKSYDVEKVLDKLGIAYDRDVDWYVIKQHDDGFHVDGTQMKKFYVVFSIAKGDIIKDASYGSSFQGLDVKDYFQITGGNTGEDGINRYHKNVYTYEVLDVIRAKTGNNNDITVNEADPTTKIVTVNSSNDVEDVLGSLGFLTDANAAADAFLKSNADAKQFVLDKYGVDVDTDDWKIDWYVIKKQSNGFHVDGAFVSLMDEWKVVYHVEKTEKTDDQKYDDIEDVTLKAKNNTAPAFADANVKNVSDLKGYENADNSKYYIPSAAKYSVNSDSKTIEITYDLVKDDWKVIYHVEKTEKTDDQKYDDIEDEVITVLKDATPAFADENVKNVSALTGYENADNSKYQLVSNNEAKYVINSNSKTIEITYDLAKDDWKVIYHVEKTEKTDDQKYDDVEDEVIAVLKDATPAFADENVKKVSDLKGYENVDNSKYYISSEAKYVIYNNSKTIEITYDLVPEKEEKQPTPEEKQPTPEVKQPTPEVKQPTPEVKQPTPEVKQPTPEVKQPTPEVKQPTPEEKQPTPEEKQPTPTEPEKEVVEEQPEEKVEEEQPVVPGTPIIYYAPTADPTPEPTPETTPEPAEEPEELNVEIPQNPEGAPEDDEEEEAPEVPQVEETTEDPDDDLIDLDTPQGTPEGTPDDEEEPEDLTVELPDVPEGLPQTGTTDVLVFYGIGLACVGLGAFAVKKGLRKEEDAE